MTESLGLVVEMRHLEEWQEPSRTKPHTMHGSIPCGQAIRWSRTCMGGKMVDILPSLIFTDEFSHLRPRRFCAMTQPFLEIRRSSD